MNMKGAFVEAIKTAASGKARAIKASSQYLGGSFPASNSNSFALAPGATLRDGTPTRESVKKMLHSDLLNCTKRKDLAAARQLSSTIVARGLMSDTLLSNTLLRLFACCGSLDEASWVFSAIPRPNVHTWQGIISAYASYGQGEQAIKLYKEMRHSNAKVNGHVYVSVLKACASTKALLEGRLVHLHTVESGLEADLHVASSILDMYMKCGSLDEAQSLFQRLSVKDVVIWGTMISGYTKHGLKEQAVWFFQQMQKEGIRANVYVGSIIVDMYARCGELDEAQKVFDRLPEKNVVLWTAMISGYSNQAQGHKAIHLFKQMQRDGVEPNKIAFMTVLQACGSSKALDDGKEIHGQLVDNGFELDKALGNSLVDMYAKCGCLNDAWAAFNSLAEKDVASWNTMMAACIHNDNGQEVLQLFGQMQVAGVEPNEITSLAILKACGNLAALDQGRQVHAYFREHGLESNAFVASSLVDMYSRCGSLEDAHRVFVNLPEKDVVAWSAMIGAYGQHGLGHEALLLFWKMQNQGLKPNNVTFLCVLSACSQSGLLSEGFNILRTMSEEYGVVPEAKHFGCMIDLLGRGGYLHEAEELIRILPVQPESEVWTSLLGACQTHGDLELARRIFEWVVKLEPTNSAAYALMSNIYAAAGRWNEESAVREKMRGAGLIKVRGKSWVTVNAEVHSFVAKDTAHPQQTQIYTHMKSLIVARRVSITNQ